MKRREFLMGCAAAAATLTPRARESLGAVDKRQAEWKAMREDPVRKMFAGPPDLDKILALFPRTTGAAAFDPNLIAENVKKLRTTPPVDTGHPFLDLSVNLRSYGACRARRKELRRGST